MASRSAARSAMIMKFEPRFVPAQLGKPPRLRERDIGVAAIWAAERDIGHIRFARDVALADLALRGDRGDPPIVKRRDADIACFGHRKAVEADRARGCCHPRSEEHTSELQSRENIVCRLLLEKKNKIIIYLKYQNTA